MEFFAKNPVKQYKHSLTNYTITDTGHDSKSKWWVQDPQGAHEQGTYTPPA